MLAIFKKAFIHGFFEDHRRKEETCQKAKKKTSKAERSWFESYQGRHFKGFKAH